MKVSITMTHIISILILIITRGNQLSTSGRGLPERKRTLGVQGCGVSACGV